jgi:hypothetical protein
VRRKTEELPGIQRISARTTCPHNWGHAETRGFAKLIPFSSVERVLKSRRLTPAFLLYTFEALALNIQKRGKSRAFSSGDWRLRRDRTGCAPVCPSNCNLSLRRCLGQIPCDTAPSDEPRSSGRHQAQIATDKGSSVCCIINTLYHQYAFLLSTPINATRKSPGWIVEVRRVGLVVCGPVVRSSVILTAVRSRVTTGS